MGVVVMFGWCVRYRQFQVTYMIGDGQLAAMLWLFNWARLYWLAYRGSGEACCKWVWTVHQVLAMRFHQYTTSIALFLFFIHHLHHKNATWNVSVAYGLHIYCKSASIIRKKIHYCRDYWFITLYIKTHKTLKCSNSKYFQLLLWQRLMQYILVWI